MSKILHQVTNLCRQNLNSSLGEKTKFYLDSRLSKPVQEKFQFGYFPNNNEIESLLSEITFEQLKQEELVFEGSKNYYTLQDHNLIMPYKDAYGEIIALIGRSLLEDKDRKDIAKYKNTTLKKSRHLFGLFEGKKSILENGYIYLVEGQFDVIQAHAHGLENVLAVGSSNLSSEQLVLLLRYSNNIRILFDNDEAGESGRSRILEKYGRYSNFQQSYVPEGFKDLDEFLTKSGEMSIREVEKALNI